MANPNIAVFPNGLPNDLTLTVVSDSSVAVLGSSINSSATVVPVSTLFNVPCILAIDNELIYVQNTSGSSYTSVIRGFNSTTATSHAAGAFVYGYIFSYTINQITSEIKAITSSLGANLSNVQLCASGTFPSSTTLHVQHNLNTEFLEFQVYDTSLNVIPFVSAHIVDRNNLTVVFSGPTTGIITIFGSRFATTPVFNGIVIGGSQNLIFGSSSFSSTLTVAVAHNLNTSNLIYQAYDGSNFAIQSGILVINDVNDATVLFAQAQSGRIVIASDTDAVSQVFVSTLAVTVVHNLGTSHVFVNIFDNSNGEIQGNTVQIVDNNTVLITFQENQTGRVVVMADPQFVYNLPFSGTSFAINHALNTQNLVVQCYSASGAAIEPNAIAIVDANNITVSFISATTGTILIKA